MTEPTVRRRWGKSSEGTAVTDETTESAPPPAAYQGSLYGWLPQHLTQTMGNGRWQWDEPWMEEEHEHLYPTPEWATKMRDNGQPCGHYLRTGQCKYGDGCKYSHKEPDMDPPAKQIGTQLDIKITPEDTNSASHEKKTEYCRHYQKGRCTFGNKCRHSHQQHRTSGYETNAASSTRKLKCHDYPDCVIGCTPEKEYCHHFFKHGNCKFGDECRLSHNHPNHVVEMDCKHYNAEGFCKMGCRPGKIYCHIYARNGKCPNGNKCRRSHSPRQ